jgi:hypothetical protein
MDAVDGSVGERERVRRVRREGEERAKRVRRRCRT